MMKRFGTLLAAGLLLITTLFTPGAARAATDDTGSLSVTGQAVLELKPDWAVVRVGINELAPTAGEAMSRATAVLSKVAEAAKAQGVKEEYIQTQGYNIYPEYRYEEVRREVEPKGMVVEQKPVLVGYRVNSTLALQTGDLAKVGALIDSSVKAGANQVQGVEFTLKDRSRYELQGFAQAIADARAKASAAAAAAGMQLNGIRRLSLNPIASEYPRPYEFSPGSMVKAEAPAFIAPGQLRLTVTVNIDYGLK